MTTLTFDTHQFVKSLVASGITEPQAEALVAELSAVQLTNVATKMDIAELKRDIAGLSSQALQQVSELRSQSQLMEQRLTVRLGGLMALGIGVLVALQQLSG